LAIRAPSQSFSFSLFFFFPLGTFLVFFVLSIQEGVALPYQWTKFPHHVIGFSRSIFLGFAGVFFDFRFNLFADQLRFSTRRSATVLPLSHMTFSCDRVFFRILPVSERAFLRLPKPVLFHFFFFRRQRPSSNRTLGQLNPGWLNFLFFSVFPFSLDPQGAHP